MPQIKYQTLRHQFDDGTWLIKLMISLSRVYLKTSSKSRSMPCVSPFLPLPVTQISHCLKINTLVMVFLSLKSNEKRCCKKGRMLIQKRFHPIVALFAWLSTYWGSQYTGSQPCISKDALLTTVSTCMILALDKKVLEFLQRIKIW